MLLVLFLAACGDDPGDTAGLDPDLFEPPPEGTTYRYQVADPGGALHWPAAFGDGEYDGEAFTEVTLGDFAAARPHGIRAWIDLDRHHPSPVRIRAIQVWVGGQDEPRFEYRFDPLLEIVLDRSIEDEPQAVAPTGEFLLNGTPYDMDIEGTWALTNTDDTVDVPYGRLDGCWIYEVDLTERGLLVSGMLELQPGVGLVRSQGLLGFSAIDLEEVEGP